MRLAGETCRERRDLERGGIDVLVEAGQREIDLTGSPVTAAMELTSQHEPRSHPGPDREEDEVVNSARNPAPPLADRGEVDVVLKGHREAEALAELGAERPPLEARNVRCQPELAAARHVDDARHADDDTVDELGVEAGRVDKRRLKRGRSVERVFGVGPFYLDVLAGPDLSAQVADRPTQEARTEIEPNHQGGLRDRLEVDGAVAGAAGLVGRLPDEAVVEQGLQSE